VVDHHLLARVDALDPVAVTTEAFRHVAHDRHPLSGSGARLHGGRWNPPESFSTLYLALERETTVNEFYRLAARQGRAPEDFLPRRMYRYEVALGAVLDLRVPSARASLSLNDAEMTANDALKCRGIGESAHYLGLEGILAPSAAGQGTVLAVFFDRLRADSHIRDIDYEPWTAPPRSTEPSQHARTSTQRS
jgi:RES domain-containing protein